MFRKFIEGLVFGAGFSISLVVIGALALKSLVHMNFEPPAQISHEMAPQSLPAPAAESSPAPFVPYQKLVVDDKIRQASIIALAEYEKQPDGTLKAVLKEILKKNPNVEFYYKLGDEYPNASQHPTHDKSVHYGDGVIIFFTGSPAMMKESITFTNGRIIAFGDMPLELFRKKCK